MSAYALLIAHELLAGVLFYTCFCRAVRMDTETTSYGVMFAFYLLGLSAILMLAAPIVSAWRPTLPTMALMLAIIIVQVVTSHYWHAGVPKPFQKVPHENAG